MQDTRQKYILFSAVGTTDPISNNKDGALLHICRLYRPEKIYVFFSKEMSFYHRNDNRYFYAIDKLSELYGDYKPEKYELIYEDMNEVHKFDIFYDIFEKHIMAIRNENPDHTILLNISSGTPAMKNALNLIAIFHDDSIQAIQVRSPFEKSNPKKEDISHYDKETEWAKNLDNCTENFEKRASEEKGLNLIARIKKEIILQHLKVYDYHAALSIAEDLKQNFNHECLQLLKAACSRIQLNEEGIKEALNGMDIEIVPVKEGHDRNIIEYMLWLQIKQKRHDYADFIRGITPVVLDIFEGIFKKQTGVDIKDFCVVKKNNNDTVYRIERSNLFMTDKGREYLNIFDNSQYFVPNYKDSNLSSIHIMALMEHYYNKSNPLIKLMKDVRNVETRVRNLAAHEIVSITDEWIYKKCGFYSEEILNKLKKLISYTGIDVPDDIWESYDLMNEKIKSYLIEGNVNNE